MHRLAQDVVAAEREAEVRDAARRAHAGAALLDQRQRLDERPGIVVVLLDPGCDGQDVRVEDDVLGLEPGLVDQQPVRALADRRPGARRSSPGPPRRTPSPPRRRRSCGSGARGRRNSSSPSLSEIELTIAFPGSTAARPRAPTTSSCRSSPAVARPPARWRSRSGTCASPARDSSRSASMFTSIRFAPPRTCSSATSTAAPKSPPSISRRKRAEPVTFVRSPISTNPVSSVIANGSSPLKRGTRPARRDDVGARGRASPPRSPPCARASTRSSEPAMFRNPHARSRASGSP